MPTGLPPSQPVYLLPPGFGPQPAYPPPAAPRKAKANPALITVIVLAVVLVCGLGAAAMSSVLSPPARPDRPVDNPFAQACADPQADPEFCGELPAEEPEREVEPPSEEGYETALPTTGSAARPDLAYAYVDRYQRLITSGAEPADLRKRVADLHKGGFGADRLLALRDQVYECEAVADYGSWGVALTPGETSMVRSGKGTATLKVRVVERVPVCVTGAKAGRAEQTQGTTDLELTFVTGKAADGREVWQLTKLRATPLDPEPLADRDPMTLGDDVPREDRTTIFAAVAS